MSSVERGNLRYRALPAPKEAIVYTRPFLEVGREKGKPPSFRCDILIGISVWNSDNSLTRKLLFEYIEEEAIGKEMVCRVSSKCRYKHLDRKNGESGIEVLGVLKLGKRSSTLEWYVH